MNAEALAPSVVGRIGRIYQMEVGLVRFPWRRHWIDSREALVPPPHRSPAWGPSPGSIFEP